jgi:hypothetical protein
LVTDACDEVLLVDAVVLVRVELSEETFPPEAVLVKEEDEVFEVDESVDGAGGEIVVDQLQQGDLLGSHWVSTGVQW